MRAASGLLCAVLLGLVACKKPVPSCDEAKTQARAAWGAYTDALEHAKAAWSARQNDAQTRLSGEIDQRLAALARKAADARYDHSSSAWLSAYQSAYHDACTADLDCKRLTQLKLDSKAAIDDLDERLVLARAAFVTADGDPERARQTAEAAIVHPEFPQLKQAQALTHAAYATCKPQPPH